MINRRKFIQQSSIAGLALASASITKALAVDKQTPYNYQSAFIKLQFDPSKPQFNYFSTDSLGYGDLAVSPLVKKQSLNDDLPAYKSQPNNAGVDYFLDDIKAWSFNCSEKQIIITTRANNDMQIPAFDLGLAQMLNHSTVLGIMPADNKMRFPCLLHMPGMGSFRISCNQPGVHLTYDSFRFRHSKEKGEPFVRLTFPGADNDHPQITYTLESVAIYPEQRVIKGNRLFDGYRKNYINIFQVNPRTRMLANNSASDACAFTMYMSAEMARHTPALTNGLSAMDLIRETLDLYISGKKGYGQVGYNESFSSPWPGEHDSLDTKPSLIIAACNYINKTGDLAWARKNYAAVKVWADKMLATDDTGNGLIKYGYSGNSDSWSDAGTVKKRPSNWWDTIGFGYEDAYANALAYHALILLAGVARQVAPGDNEGLFTAAAKLKSNYYSTFYNPQTGVLAGWKSKDGKQHDYYFTFVNGVAVSYGLLTETQGKQVMQGILDKMQAVGYTNFSLGLPGNLIPIRREDYVHHDHRWGYGANEDGSDGFQVYENGGATACYSYFTIKALYQLGMRNEADKILLPMMDSFTKGDFEGKCSEGSEMTKDWKTWNGECWGYEGFLTDNYLTFLAMEYYRK